MEVEDEKGSDEEDGEHCGRVDREARGYEGGLERILREEKIFDGLLSLSLETELWYQDFTISFEACFGSEGPSI